MCKTKANIMKIIIADDHPFTLKGTKYFVESLGYQVVDICSNGIHALSLIDRYRPDIAILDINMPGMDAIEVLGELERLRSRTRVILLTMHKEMSIYKKALEYGVHGYILKDFAQEELAVCIAEVGKNNRYTSKYLDKSLVIDRGISQKAELGKLSFVEQKIVVLVAKQHTSKEIADFLFLSEKTIETHRGRIIEKLGLPKEKNVLVKWAIQNIDVAGTHLLPQNRVY